MNEADEHPSRMATERTIRITLQREPPEEADPLGYFLSLDRVRHELQLLGIEPENPAHIERRGRRSLSIHFTDENDMHYQLCAFLESFRALMGYSIENSDNR